MESIASASPSYTGLLYYPLTLDRTLLTRSDLKFHYAQATTILLIFLGEELRPEAKKKRRIITYYAPNRNVLLLTAFLVTRP
jgi:hypothetical protein